MNGWRGGGGGTCLTRELARALERFQNDTRNVLGEKKTRDIIRETFVVNKSSSVRVCVCVNVMYVNC